MKKFKKISYLYKNNWVAIGLLLTGLILAIIGIVGFAFNQRLFSSFSWFVFGVLCSIAGYMLYNIKKLLDEIHRSKEYNNSKK